MRQKILLIAAVLFGLLAAYLTYSKIQSDKEELLKRFHKVELIVLKEDVSQGETIELEDLDSKTIEVSRSYKGREILWRDRNVAIKQKADRTLTAGTFLKYSDLQYEISRSQGLAGIIGMGNRAISISVDTTASVNSLVKPGDRVDIIGTFRFPEMKGDKNLEVITLTILQSVRILACGKEMAARSRSTRTASRSKGYNTVTLQLTPKEVEMIVFASQKGRLVLSLRHYDESAFEKELQPVNWGYLKDNIKKYNEERERRNR